MTPAAHESREAWLEAKDDGIGSSDAAQLYTGRFGGLWGLVGRRLDFLPPVEQTEEMATGFALEGGIVKRFNEKTGLRAVLAPPFTLLAGAESWMLATLDTTPECVVELKCVGAAMAADWGPDGTPAHESASMYAAAQLLWQLKVCGQRYGFVAALVGDWGGWGVRVYPMDAEHPTCRAVWPDIYGRAREAWGYIQRREMPPIDASPECAAVVRGMHKAEPGPPVVLNGDAPRWAALHVEATEGLKYWAAVRREAASHLGAAIGSATEWETDGFTGTFRPDKNGQRRLRARRAS